MSVIPGNFLRAEQEKREKRCQEEEISVTELGNGTFEATNHSHQPPTRYLVQAKHTPGNSVWALNCECPDFLTFCSRNFLKCKHMLAVEMSSNGNVSNHKEARVHSHTGRLLQNLLRDFNLPELVRDISNGIPQTVKSLRETNQALEQTKETLESQLDDYLFQLEEAAYANGRTDRERKKKYRTLMAECLEVQEAREKLYYIRQEMTTNQVHCDFLTDTLRQKCALATLIAVITTATATETGLNLKRGEKNENTGRTVLRG